MIRSVEEDLFVRHFGVGSKRFERELKAELEEAAPEQRAEFEQLLDQAHAALPGMHATLDRIETSLAGVRAQVHGLGNGIVALGKRLDSIEAELSAHQGEAGA